MIRIIDTTLIVLGLLLLAAACWVHLKTGFFGDKQWEMLYARMWLGGKRLYSDIFPVSPPLIFWLYAIPASLAPDVSGAFPMLACLGLAVIAFSIFLCLRLSGFHPGFAASTPRKTELAALLAFTLVLRTNPIYFLDREHLFLVLTLPYIFRFLPGLANAAVSPWLKTATGLLAGIGFCMKPHCFVIFAGLQLVYLITRRSLRILLSCENLIIYGIGLSYVLTTLLLYPEYFSTVLPMALAAYSETRDDTPVFDYAANTLSILVPTFLMFRLRDISPYRRDIIYLLALLPFFFAYALLNNNWAYTYYPLSSITLILTGFVMWEFICLRKTARAQGLPVWRFHIGIIACLLCFLFRLGLSVNLFLMIHADTCTADMRCRGDDRMVAELAGENGPRSFGTISIEFARWTRVAYFANAPWETRFPQLWMMPKLLMSDAAFRQKNHWIFDVVAEGLADDMEKRRPEVMFVDDTDYMYAHYIPTDFIRYFSDNPRFKAAWTHYGFKHKIDLCGPPAKDGTRYKANCSYDVYRRVD